MYLENAIIQYLQYPQWASQRTFIIIAISRFLSLSHYITSTCAKASRHTYTHTQQTEMHTYNHVHSRAKMRTDYSSQFWHSPYVASYTVYPSFWKVTLYNTLRISHHILVSLHTKPSTTRLPLQACSLFTHTVLTCCEELPTATLTISKSNWVREIHFGFFLFFRCSVRQLLWWWDTKTALAANVHMSGKSTEVVFLSMSVCIYVYGCVCLCFLNNA